MKKKFPKLLLFLFILSPNFYAQIKNGDVKKDLITLTQPRTPSGYIRCYTDEHDLYLRQEFPNMPTKEQFESWLAPLVEKHKQDEANGKNVKIVYNIPVVVHIVHNGDALGTGENITDAQARSQITILNEDYRRMTGTRGGANTTGLATDIEVNFCLAQIDPSGNITTGIVRHNLNPPTNNVTPAGDWETQAQVETIKDTYAWNPNNYLNMWSFRLGGNPPDHPTAPGLQGVLGYATFPDLPSLPGGGGGSGTPNRDGVVANYATFGSIDKNDGTFILSAPYNLGRTMTHEVGHWLGLRHIWGDNATCPATNSNADKDYCADTPAAAGPNGGCNLNANSCPATPGNDMVQNYMDYTDDSCMDTFTPNQKARIVMVMQNAPRRATLNASTACQAPAPYIQFLQPTGSTIEGSNCSFTDVIIPVSIAKAPSANAIVSITPSAVGTTATNNVDFQIMTPTLTFPTGTNASQNLTLRIFNDGLVEGTETIALNMTLNANGGDALLNTSGNTLTYTINDNDVVPNATTVTTVLSEDFEDITDWSVIDGDADTKSWLSLNGAAGVGTAPNTIVGKCAASAKDRTVLGQAGVIDNPDNYLLSPIFTVPSGANSIDLTYIIGGYGGTTAAGNYTVYFFTNPSVTLANIQASPQIQASATVPTSTTQLKSHSLSAYAGQTGRLVFRHNNTGTTNTALLLLDTVNLTATVSTPVQTTVNNSTQYQATIPTAGTSYATDATTGYIMAGITSDTFNYGCTGVYVNRDQTTAGAPAVNYGSNTAVSSRVMAKSFTVNSATNNPTGNVTIKFYFTNAEIAAWETATGNSRNALKVIKNGVTVPYATTLGTFGTTGVTLQATFANGINGTYYFGTDNTLSATNYEIVNAISIYPNPANNVLNIAMPGSFENLKYVIYNNLGQVVKSNTITSKSDLQINISGLSAGVYFIKLDKEASVKTLQFIKN